MAKLTTMKATDSPSVMLFGAPFTGKSLLAGKLAEHFNLIYVDMEGGHDVLFQLPIEWQEKIEVIALPDTNSYPIAIETVLKMVKGKVDICEEHGKVGCAICRRKVNDLCKQSIPEEYEDIESAHFTTIDLPTLDKETIVIFDSSTQLTASAIAHITKKEDDDYKLQTDDWGGLAKLMDVFYSHIQTAKYKRIVISHITEAKQDDKRTLLFPVAGSRNFSSNVAKFFDHVVYLEKKNKKHMAASSTTYMNNIMTGSRTNVAMETMDEATLLAIFAPDKVSADKRLPETKATSSSATAGTGSADNKLSKLKAKLGK